MMQIEKNTVSSLNQVDNHILFENKYGNGKRVLFFGNSITRHAVKKEIGWLHDWGMAASAKEKDYVHIVMEYMKKIYKDAVFCICQGSVWERSYKKGEETYPLYVRARDFKADLIIMRIIENCDIEDFDKNVFKEEYCKLLQYLNATGKARIIITSSFWKRDGDDILQKIAEEIKGEFVYLGDLGECPEMRADGLFEHSGVSHHPGDFGMFAIANRIKEKI